MQYNKQQERALSAIQDWFLDSEEQIFRLFGYAGTGKTTLAKQIADNISGKVLYAAFTGKAAYVMDKLGCTGATTIHSLIYTPKDKSRNKLLELKRHLKTLQDQEPVDMERIKKGKMLIAQEEENLKRPIFTLNTESPVSNASLVIIDECSMVNEYMAKDLLSFGTKILVLGDPAQLPPVKGNGYFINHQPDVMLTDIHRQARDNPIIDIATKIRAGQSIQRGQYGKSRIITPEIIETNDALNANQIIVGTNRTRKACNKRMRYLIGHENPYPEINDKLICLKNNNEKGLLNGACYYVTECPDEPQGERYPMVVKDECSGDTINVEAHINPFKNEAIPYWDANKVDHFDFGYAITCHKSQGSQWDNVLLFDESRVFGNNRKKWLYTAVTRCCDTLTMVR